MTEDQRRAERMLLAAQFHSILLKSAKDKQYTRSAVNMAKVAVEHADALLEALRDP